MFVCLSFGSINRNRAQRYCLLLSFYHRLYYVLKQLPSVDDLVVKTIKKATKINIKFELTQPNCWKKYKLK